MFFASDNTSAVHPKVIEALSKANEGYATPYSGDRLTDELVEKLRDLFHAPDALIYPMMSGTATNAALLGAMSPPWGQIYCHDTAHIAVDERNSVPFYTGGAALRRLAGASSRIDTDLMRDIATADQATTDIHAAPPAAVSISNLTEFGTAYTAAMVSDIAAAARLPLHMDGARFANAMATTGASPWEMTRELSALSLGATKNGTMGAEVAILFDPALQTAFESQRMRGGHNLSKSRYISAQMLAWLEDDLWLTLARHANAMATRLARGLTEFGGTLSYPVEGNMVFATLPYITHMQAKARGAAYHLWEPTPSPKGDPDTPIMARFVASWSTTETEVDALLNTFAG